MSDQDYRGAGQPRPNSDFITPEEIANLNRFKLMFPVEYPKILQATANLEAWGIENPVIVEGSTSAAETDVVYVVEGDLPDGSRFRSTPYSHPVAALTEAGRWLYERIKSGQAPDPSKTDQPELGLDGRPLT